MLFYKKTLPVLSVADMTKFGADPFNGAGLHQT